MSMQVLIVGETSPQREAIHAFLTQSRALAAFELQIRATRSAGETMARFAERPADLVLVDLRAERIDGAALCLALRQQPGAEGVAIIALGDNSHGGALARQLWDTAHVELVGRPLDLDALASRILVLLRRREVADRTRPRKWFGRTTASTPAASGTATTTTDTAHRSRTTSQGRPAVTASIPSTVPWVTGPELDFEQSWRIDLSRWPLGTVLLAAAVKRATGSLTVLRDNLARRAIGLDRGVAIYIESNLRVETLGAYLLGQRMVTEEQLAAAQRAARARPERLGPLLVTQGAIDRGALEQAVAAQARIKLFAALRDADGTATFEPGSDALSKTPRHAVEIAPFVLSALERLAATNDLKPYLEQLGTDGVRLSANGRPHAETISATYGALLLDPSLSTRPLFQVVQAAGARGRLLPRVAVLLDLGLFERAPLKDTPHDSRGEPRRQATNEWGALPSYRRQGPTLPLEDLANAANTTDDSTTDQPGGSPLAHVATPPTAARPVEGWRTPLSCHPVVPATISSPPPTETAEPGPRRLAHALGGELLFRQAERRLALRDAAGAIAALELALEADAQQPDYHALLGWALFLRYGGTPDAGTLARVSIERAFALQRDCPLAHEIEAGIAERLGDQAAAAEHLLAVMFQGPNRIDLLPRVERLLGEVGDYSRLEETYRALIAALRDDPQVDLVALWLALAQLYRRRLNRDEDARLALQVAERLAPGDPRVRAAMQTGA